MQICAISLKKCDSRVHDIKIWEYLARIEQNPLLLNHTMPRKTTNFKYSATKGNGSIPHYQTHNWRNIWQQSHKNPNSNIFPRISAQVMQFTCTWKAWDIVASLRVVRERKLSKDPWRGLKLPVQFENDLFFYTTKACCCYFKEKEFWRICMNASWCTYWQLNNQGFYWSFWKSFPNFNAINQLFKSIFLFRDKAM